MTIFSTAQGIWGCFYHETSLNVTRQAENDVQDEIIWSLYETDLFEKRFTYFALFIFQSFQARATSFLAITVINKALTLKPLGNLTPISRKTSIITQIAIIAPIGLACLYLYNCSKAEKTSPTFIGRVFLFINKQAGTISQVTQAVTYIALFALGNKKEAFIGLILMGTGIADRKKLLPKRFSAFFNQYLPIIVSASGIVFANRKTEKVSSAIILALQVNELKNKFK